MRDRLDASLRASRAELRVRRAGEEADDPSLVGRARSPSPPPVSSSSSPSSSSSDDSSDDWEDDAIIEEDARLARLARLRNRRDCAARARAEHATLAEIRRARDDRAALDASLDAARRELERRCTLAWGDDADVARAERAARAAAETLDAASDAARHAEAEAEAEAEAAAGADAEARWRDHERRWAAFERRCRGESSAESEAEADRDRGSSSHRPRPRPPVRVRDVPWPPASMAEALAIAVASAAASRRAGADDASGRTNARHRGGVASARRRAFKRLSLRWHPDKFLARFGRRLASDADEGADAGLEPGETHAGAIARRVREIAAELNDARAAMEARGGEDA